MSLYIGAFAVSLGYGMLTPFVGTLIAQTQSSVEIGLLMAFYPLAKAAGYATCMMSRVRAWPGTYLLMVTAVSYAALGVTFSVVVSAAARSLEGFVFGWFLATASAEIASSGKAVGYRLSWLNGMSSAGVLVGPLLVAGANALGHSQAAFLAVALICACAAALRLRPMPVPTRSSAETFVPALAGARSWALMVLFASFDFTFGALSLTIPIAFERRSVDALTATAALFTGGFIVFTVLMPVFGRLGDRLRLTPSLVTSTVVISTLFLLLSRTAMPPFELTALLLGEYIAAAAAYSFALAELGNVAPGSFPIVGVTQSIAMSVGSLMAGRMLATGGPLDVFAFLSGTYLVSAALITASSIFGSAISDAA